MESVIAFVDVKLETDVIESDLAKGVRELDWRAVPLFAAREDLLSCANDALDKDNVASTLSASPAGSLFSGVS